MRCLPSTLSLLHSPLDIHLPADTECQNDRAARGLRTRVRKRLAKQPESRGLHFIGWHLPGTPKTVFRDAAQLGSHFRRRFLQTAAFLLLSPLVWSHLPSAAYAQNEIQIEIVDRESGIPVPARIEFTKSLKKLTKDRKTLSQGDIWLADGLLTLKPPPAEYEFRVRRGPEFTDIQGGFTVERGAHDVVRVEIPRSIEMAKEYWFSADHGVHVSDDSLSKWQTADAIDMVSNAQTKPDSKTNSKPAPKPPTPKKKQADAPEPTPLDLIGHQLSASNRSFQSPNIGVVIHSLRDQTNSTNQVDAKQSSANNSVEADTYALLESIDDPSSVAIEISQPWTRDVPILLAIAPVKCIQLLSAANKRTVDDRIQFSNLSADQEFGRVQLGTGKDRIISPIFAPIDATNRIRYKDPRGLGMLSEYLYWQMLEAGLQLTPTAASGFGKVDTHLGYNRHYVFCDESFTSTAYWNAIRSGKTFVTNGPLLRTFLNGTPPGSVLPSYRGDAVQLDIGVSLAVRDPVDYLEVIWNGESLYNAKLEDHYKRGEFPPMEVKESGWLLVRVVTSHTDGYRLASTAPFYIEFDAKKRISKKAVQFFVDWLDRSEKSIREQTELLDTYEPLLEKAHAFWNEQLTRCTAP